MPSAFQVIAADYDGTLTSGAAPDAAVLDAIAGARSDGRRRIVLVTGRILAELRHAFPGVGGHFDAIVAENGAVLSGPARHRRLEASKATTPGSAPYAVACWCSTSSRSPTPVMCLACSGIALRQRGTRPLFAGVCRPGHVRRQGGRTVRTNREDCGLRRWVVVDEAHRPFSASIPVFGDTCRKGYPLITWQPDQLPPETIGDIDSVLALASPDGENKPVADFLNRWSTDEDLVGILAQGEPGQALLSGNMGARAQPSSPSPDARPATSDTGTSTPPQSCPSTNASTSGATPTTPPAASPPTFASSTASSATAMTTSSGSTPAITTSPAGRSTSSMTPASPKPMTHTRQPVSRRPPAKRLLQVIETRYIG